MTRSRSQGSSSRKRMQLSNVAPPHISRAQYPTASILSRTGIMSLVLILVAIRDWCASRSAVSIMRALRPAFFPGAPSVLFSVISILRHYKAFSPPRLALARSHMASSSSGEQSSKRTPRSEACFSTRRKRPANLAQARESAASGLTPR